MGLYVDNGVKYGAVLMAEIVGNLKDFSRLDRSKVTSFNVNDGPEQHARRACQSIS